MDQSLRRIIYPPKKIGPYCVMRFRQAPDVVRLGNVPKVINVRPELHPAIGQIANTRALCNRCRIPILAGKINQLLRLIDIELLHSGIDAKIRPSALLEADLGMAFALWCIGGVTVDSVSVGHEAWSALVDRYPKDLQAPSVVERDFGGNVYAAISTYARGLWIEDFVSRDRGQGNAKRARESFQNRSLKHSRCRSQRKSACYRLRLQHSSRSHRMPCSLTPSWFRLPESPFYTRKRPD
jgi:hypothetical protein